MAGAAPHEAPKGGFLVLKEASWLHRSPCTGHGGVHFVFPHSKSKARGCRYSGPLCFFFKV